MQVDFYHLTRDPLATALGLIAGKVLADGGRLLVVSSDQDQRRGLSEALWAAGPSRFLANGLAGEGDEARQPILLSEAAVAVNGARFLAIVDGQWREGESTFDRTFFFFEEAGRGAAREVWADLGRREGLTRNYWKQDGGRWVKAG